MTLATPPAAGAKSSQLNCSPKPSLPAPQLSLPVRYNHSSASLEQPQPVLTTQKPERLSLDDSKTIVEPLAADQLPTRCDVAAARDSRSQTGQLSEHYSQPSITYHDLLNATEGEFHCSRKLQAPQIPVKAYVRGPLPSSLSGNNSEAELTRLAKKAANIPLQDDEQTGSQYWYGSRLPPNATVAASNWPYSTTIHQVSTHASMDDAGCQNRSTSSIPPVRSPDREASTSDSRADYNLPPPPGPLGPLVAKPPVTGFQSDEAKVFWDTLGPLNPYLVSDILESIGKSTHGNLKWYLICFAVAQPLAYKLMVELDALYYEVLKSLKDYPVKRVSVLETSRDYSDPNWTVCFQDFYSNWRSPDWHDRVQELCLLGSTYQSASNNLYKIWSVTPRNPPPIWDKLKRFDKLKQVLVREIANMPAMVEQARLSSLEDEARLEKVGNDSSSELNLVHSEQDPGPHFRGTTRGRHKRPPPTTFLGLIVNLKDDFVNFLSLFAQAGTYGTQQAAYLIVCFLSVSATITMAFSVWRCGPSEMAIYIDSNFWSTCSQMFTGLGGLYCLSIPLLQHADLGASDPKLFKLLLTISFVTAVIAVVVYHFQTRASLIIALISGLAGLAATLMLVEDARNKITEQALSVDRLEHEVVMLRRQQ